MNEQGQLFGEILVRLGLVSALQIQEALALQRESRQRIGEALVTLGYVTREQIQLALFEALGLGEAAPSARPPLGQLLIGLKYLTPQQLGEGLAQQQRDRRRLGEILVGRSACTYKQVYEALALQQRLAGQGPLAVETQARAVDRLAASRVMVVDDSPLACALVSQGLEALGYAVTTFEDPFEALSQVPKLKPSIVLTDLDMPGIDGAELCRKLKSGPARNIPVIILTANDADALRISGLRAGADDFVNKSASMEELAARIDSIVRRTGETERMRKLFARYTSDAVVEEILKSGEIVLTGEKREVTVLFADIRNFTSLAETLAPEQVVGLLNEVLGRLSDAVLTCGGTLDKFLGDGLMAVFGAPVGREDDALRALQAAQMMQEQMGLWHEDARRDFEQGRRPAPPPVLQLGIGINSGPAVAGNLGSTLRTEYTCIGDAVNVGSRLCAFAAPGEILVGDRTRALIAEGGHFEALPPVRLKGKAQLVPLFRAVYTGGGVLRPAG